MTTLFLILIVLASILLGLIVLIQNPKGGGLAGNIAGFSSQFMGVKQTNDVLEKGTWILASVVAVLCLISSLLISDTGGTENNLIKGINPSSTTAPVQPSTTPGQQQLPAQPVDSQKK